jgi:ribonuclease HII
MILAGIDEAGYGPMLGPLVVAAAVFRVGGDRAADGAARESTLPDLWEVLSSAVSRMPKGLRVAVNDSKKLFQQGKGLRRLEEGVLPFLFLRTGSLPGDFRDLLRRVARRPRASADDYLESYPWYRGQNLSLPRDTYANAVTALAERLGGCLRATAVDFLGLGALPVEVVEFNRDLESSGNKANVSFRAVSSFLRRLWRQFAAEPVHVCVDRQGGRTEYSRQLLGALRPRGIQITEETAAVSRYRVVRREPTGGEFHVTFATDSETRCLPVALASMLAKYLRELHMEVFNAFWTSKQTDLRPTAGYVTDARRFLTDTAALRRELRIDPGILVRRR